MSSQWRILDFTSFEGKIHSDDGAIVVVNSDGVSQRVSVADVAVVLIGMKVSFSAGVIHRLTDKDIAVLFCDWRGVPESGAFSWSEHTRVGARHKAQLELSLPRRKNAWGRIVRSKIQGQAAVLRNLNRPGAQELEHIAGQVRSGDPSNLEGQAARIYWSKTLSENEHRESAHYLAPIPALIMDMRSYVAMESELFLPLVLDLRMGFSIEGVQICSTLLMI